MTRPSIPHSSRGLALVTLAFAALGAGCAKDAPVPYVPPSPVAAPQAIVPQAAPNGLMSEDEGAPVDGDFTAGSEYMRETPERYADLKGKRPFVMYFYADWCPECRKQHPELVALFDRTKFGTLMLRVNYKDNQVTDEGVEWAKEQNIAYQHTFVAFDASGKEVARHTGPIDEAKMRELFAKANGE